MLKEKILVGMSGGVDSSVAVKKLQEQGYEVTGLYLDMKHTDSSEPQLITNPENENEDIKSAYQCAESYGIPLYKFGCKTAFEEKVTTNFAEEYSKGRTPNPCVVCNRLVKFRYLLRCADALGCSKVATGHYAKVAKDAESGRFYVECGTDEKKDQSYMLWNLTEEQLGRIVFPLGSLTKAEIYQIAKSDALAAADRGESLDICFIDKGENYTDFIEEKLGKKFPGGDFISPDGKVCGKHKGIIHYTVGQRKGLGIALGEPVFVKKIDAAENKIYLARSGEEYTDRIRVSCLNFQLLRECESYSADLQVKIRYAAKKENARVEIENGKCYVSFPESVRAATPGQSAVFYKNNKVLFGGFID